MIERFETYLRSERGASANTTAAYISDLTQWREFMTSCGKRDFHPEDMSSSDLRSWLAHLSRNATSPRSIRRKISALRAFYRFMNLRCGLKTNPAEDLILTKIPKPLPSFSPPAETRTMLDNIAVDTDADDLKAMTRRLVLEILYATGMRCSELTGLLDIAVDTRIGQARVLGKRGKERIVPLGEDLCRLIEDYRGLRDATCGISKTLLCRDDASPLSRVMVYSIVHKAMAENGIHATRLSPHVLRHSCATDLLNAGTDLNAVKELLGHASLQTTQIYTHLTTREIKDNYLHAHPRVVKTNNP